MRRTNSGLVIRAHQAVGSSRMPSGSKAGGFSTPDFTSITANESHSSLPYYLNQGHDYQLNRIGIRTLSTAMVQLLWPSQRLPFTENVNNLHRLDISARLSQRHGSSQPTHLAKLVAHIISPSAIVKVDKGVGSWIEPNHGICEMYCWSMIEVYDSRFVASSRYPIPPDFNIAYEAHNRIIDIWEWLLMLHWMISRPCESFACNFTFCQEKGLLANFRVLIIGMPTAM